MTSEMELFYFSFFLIIDLCLYLSSAPCSIRCTYLYILCLNLNIVAFRNNFYRLYKATLKVYFNKL